jgi:hypothetical protein
MSLVQQGKPILANFEAFQLNTEFMQKKLIGDFFEAQLEILNKNWTLKGFPQFGFYMSHIHQSSVQHSNHHGYQMSSTQSQNALVWATYNTTFSTVFAGYRFE